MQYLRADAMTQRSDEITMENPNIVHGFSHSVYIYATAILVNQQKNIIQQFGCHMDSEIFNSIGIL